MKKISASTLSSVLWNALAVFGVVVVAGVVGVVIAGAFAYRQFRADPDAAKAHQAQVHTEPLVPAKLADAPAAPVQPIQRDAADHDGESEATIRPVAAEPSDQAHFSYADYHIDVSRIPPATFVRGRVSDILPPPLDPVAEQSGNAFDKERPRLSLSDPGSHYIVDSRTGRVIGIDGTAGAADEARQRRWQAAAEAARLARATPVLAAQPVDDSENSDLPPPKPNLYVPVRRALPVIEISPGQPFNAASEVADDPRPVMRAEPVIIVPANRPAQHTIPLP